ncbi:multidrug effflux MFS transporter [Vibrio ruber]|uniref:multidrug effflux MFS transporter n=1 Tax=Vibrio ruber TaxID=184755 RepID=UPI00289342AD|nr:multidrug effflux MFS transporter [Vibrio ruber]WNJ96982.1 multidrug effflux MFS transporter [Vibrio ruber]
MYIDEKKGLLSPKVVLVLGLLSAIAALSTDMYLPLFPDITSSLQTTPARVQLSITAFMIGLSVGQLIIGPCSDHYGRRKLLLGGTMLLTVASMACALSSNIELLIVARFFQGLGGAAGIVLARAIISDLCPRDRAAQYFNLVLAIQGIAPIAAPLIGGVASYFIWPVVFVFMALIAFITTFFSGYYVRESLPIDQRPPFSFYKFFSQLYCLVSNKPYLAYTLIFSTQFGALFAYISASPFIYQSLFKFSAGEFSIIFSINAGIMMLGSIISARYVLKYGANSLMRGGIICTLVISLLLCIVDSLSQFQCEITIILLFFMMFSMSFIFGNAASMAMAATSNLKGTGSAVMGAIQFCSAAITPPLLGFGNPLSVLPMALVITGCSVISILALLLTTTEGRSDE